MFVVASTDISLLKSCKIAFFRWDRHIVYLYSLLEYYSYEAKINLGISHFSLHDYKKKAF